LRALQQRWNRFRFYLGILDFSGCCKFGPFLLFWFV
jgi:hypothetical protein